MIADVCLILEGTYPYVSGGVSSWVHGLIRDLSNLKFSILFLGALEDEEREYKYSIPDNVVELRECYLQASVPIPSRMPRSRFKPDDWARLSNFLGDIRRGKAEAFAPLVTKTFIPGRISQEELLYGEDTWKYLLERYRHLGQEPSFVDFVWSWRFIHLPIFRVLSVPIPAAKCYHTVSTGYAGLVAAAARARTGAPMILTEHGIYTRERRIEIAQSQWILDERDDLVIDSQEAFFKDWWVKMFVGFSKISYHYADSIVTLFEGNRQVQISEGADPAKTRVIPNGVDIAGYAKIKKPDLPRNPPTVGFVGRVVPIKDVKTFLRAMKILHKQIPNVHGLILGPTEEDPTYFQECQILMHMLGLGGVVDFAGKVDVKKAYPQIDVLVLTSISEAQPLVMLEGFACGIPSVASNVGACRELIHGREPDDVVLGPSGIITPIGDPQATAAAIEEVLKDPERYRRMVHAGKTRVKQFYRLGQVSANYQALYEQLPLLADLKRSRGETAI